MNDRDEFLAWVNTTLVEAERALHDGDDGPRLHIWSQSEPVSVLGAWRNALGRQELVQLFEALATSFSDCVDYAYELSSFDVVGEMAYTAGYEHISTSVDGEPRTFTLRCTQVYRRENDEWRVAHRHADTVS